MSHWLWHVAPTVVAARSILLRPMRHQEHMLAVGTHNWPTRIYRPTEHAIGTTAAIAAGLDTISDDYWLAGAAGRRRGDLAAAAGARATCISLLWAGRSSWQMRVIRATPRYGTDDYATAGAGRRVSPEHGTLPGS